MDRKSGGIRSIFDETNAKEIFNPKMHKGKELITLKNPGVEEYEGF